MQKAIFGTQPVMWFKLWFLTTDPTGYALGTQKDIRHLSMWIGVCLFGRWRVTELTVFLNSCSRWHAACTCIGVAHPPCSRSALPCVRVTHYGLSKQMACPQRWYNFLGGRSCETKCHLSTHRENAISCSHPRKQNPPCPSAFSVTIDFYSHLDPPLIRRWQILSIY